MAPSAFGAGVFAYLNSECASVRQAPLAQADIHTAQRSKIFKKSFFDKITGVPILRLPESRNPTGSESVPYHRIISGSPLHQQWWSSFNVAPSEREAKTTFQRLHFGFSALPAGYYVGSYYDFGGRAYFWSATEVDSSNAYLRTLYYNAANVNRGSNNKNNGFSVRCVRD